MPGIEHAGGSGRTLCGIRGRYLKLFLHHFQPRAPASCRKCRALAEEAPSRPCGQERLHDLLLQEADDGPLRTDLLTALRRGARIAISVTGPAKDLTRFHSRIGRMTEEAGPAAEALAAAKTSITPARVEDTDRQYLVVRFRMGNAVVWPPWSMVPAVATPWGPRGLTLAQAHSVCSPNRCTCSAPRNEVRLSTSSPRRVSTVIDHARCGADRLAPT